MTVGDSETPANYLTLTDRLELLWSCLNAAKAFLAVRFARPVGDHPRFICVTCVDFTHTFITCVRLALLELPGWDLQRVKAELSLVEVETQRASPFASSLLFDYVATYMYEGDTPNAERRAAALSLDRDLLRELLGQEELRELLDPSAVEEVEQQLRGEPRNPDELHDLLRLRGDLRVGEFDEAQKFFELAVQYHPDFEEAQLGLAAVLMSLQKPNLALPHLQKAITLNAGNEVSWYRLSQAQGMLGHADEQKKTFAEFQRLRSQKSSRQEAGKQILSPDEVTPQQVDPSAK